MTSLQRVRQINRHLNTYSRRTFSSGLKMALNLDSTAKMPSGYELPLLGYGKSFVLLSEAQ